jgi:chitodextrinase
LAWGTSTDDTVVSGYRLWRDGQPLVTLGVTNYTDRGLTPYTAYTYQVQASDAAGNWSALSAPVTVTTPAALDLAGEAGLPVAVSLERLGPGNRLA